MVLSHMHAIVVLNLLEKQEMEGHVGKRQREHFYHTGTRTFVAPRENRKSV